MATDPHPDPLADSAPTAELLESLQPILRRILAERTLSPGKMGILRHVAENGRASTAELASTVQVSPQAISLATRELEGLGLIRRVPDETDRRRMWVHPTEAGRGRLGEETLAGRSWLHQVIQDRLTPAERQTLTHAIPVLRKLTAAVDSEPPRG
ncbi:MarR family winged helix-turn-helix transcriptional regulator [Microbacterium sp. A93]|uniref:MarR family winged helix-turn-helix transcriptional regulator n=1 Tax=Microbacterium sp. A93 TaxID=3450716 RepID=UPI003F41DD8F